MPANDDHLAAEQDETSAVPDEAPDGASIDEEPSDETDADPVEELEEDSVELQLARVIESLREDLAERDRKLREYIDAHNHAVEQMDAARKRMERDREEELDRGRAAVASELLDVVDNLDRSIDSGSRTGNLDAVLEGLGLIRERVTSKLGEMDVERMETTGARFDPNLHEAVGVIPVTDEAQDQQIIGEEQAGYLFKGRLLRAARVIIGALPDA